MNTVTSTAFVIRNTATVAEDGPLYWNNDSGWGGYASAERYEDQSSNLPIDGAWQHAYEGVVMLKGDESWFGRLQKRGFTQDILFADGEWGKGANLDLEKLKNKMLDHAGAAVVMTFEADLDKLLSDRVAFIDGSNHRMEEGEPSQCHGNAAALWDENSDRFSIFTGYAMSDDGVWRQHSWAYDKFDKVIVETTESRIVYFGFELNTEESSDFFDANYYL